MEFVILRGPMNDFSTPLKLAMQSFVVCLACCAAVVLLSHGAALKEPARLGIMLFVLVMVPAGNYFISRWRQRNAG
jgi:hypothetical protein